MRTIAIILMAAISQTIHAEITTAPNPFYNPPPARDIPYSAEWPRSGRHNNSELTWILSDNDISLMQRADQVVSAIYNKKFREAIESSPFHVLEKLLQINKSEIISNLEASMKNSYAKYGFDFFVIRNPQYRTQTNGRISAILPYTMLIKIDGEYVIADSYMIGFQEPGQEWLLIDAAAHKSLQAAEKSRMHAANLESKVYSPLISDIPSLESLTVHEFSNLFELGQRIGAEEASFYVKSYSQGKLNVNFPGFYERCEEKDLTLYTDKFKKTRRLGAGFYNHPEYPQFIEGSLTGFCDELSAFRLAGYRIPYETTLQD